MDIEQLKLILETVNAAGEGAYSIAIFWIARELLIGVLWWAAFVYAVYRVSRIFLSLVGSATLTGRLAVAMQRREGAYNRVDLSAESTEGHKNRDALVAFVRENWQPAEPPKPSLVE